ncbi:hypothetical protein Tco_0393512 [Tanacetum coccineum]
MVMGINGNLDKYYHCRGEVSFCHSTYSVKPSRETDAAYLQQQLQIAQKEEAGIQSTQEEFEFMAAADAYEETERVKVNLHFRRYTSAASIFTSGYSKCVVTANHDVCVLNYVNNMNSRTDNQSAIVLIRENQKKHKANAKKSKELESKGSLASSRPSKPRTCLRWIPTGRIFSMCGKLTASSNTENKSEKYVCDNASTSNPSEPSSKGILISTSLLGRLSRLRKQQTSIYSIAVL